MLKDMKIGKKLIIGFSILIILLLSVAYTGYKESSEMDETLRHITDVTVTKALFAKDQILRFNLNNTYMRDLILHTDPKDFTNDTITLRQNAAVAGKNIDTISKLVESSEETAILNEVASLRKEYAKVRSEILRLCVAVNTPESHLRATSMLYNEFDQQYRLNAAVTQKLYDFQSKKLVETEAQAKANAQSSRNSILLFSAISLLIAVLLVWYLSKNIGTILKQLRGSIEKAINNAVNGNLSYRSDRSVVPLEFQPLLSGMNELVDAFVQPLNISAEYIDRISKGDIPPKITDEYKGDFNEIKVNLNQCIDSVSILVVGVGRIVDAIKDGNLKERANEKRLPGDWNLIVKGINGIIENLVKPIEQSSAFIEGVAIGKLPPKITDDYKGDFNTLKNNMNHSADVLHSLVVDIEKLIKAAIDGKLDIRADASKYNNAWNGIVQGINDTLDAVIGPLNVAAEYIDRISKGEIPQVITNEYKGDFNEIKSNLNLLITSTNGVTEAAMAIAAGKLDIKLEKRSANDKLIVAFQESIASIDALAKDVKYLSQSAVDGKLDVRANANKHHGEYKEIIEGVNSTLDAVIGPLNVAAEYVDRISKGDMPPKITDDYKGDFNEIKNNLNHCIDNVTSLISGISRISTNIIDGNVKYRGNENLFTGDWRKIAAGTNEIIEAFAKPLQVTSDYIDKISKGEIPELITEEYKGEFNNIKNNLNQCINAINLLVSESSALSQSAIRGELSTRADANKLQGDYRKIIEGVNNTLDSIVEPINEAGYVLERFSLNDTSNAMSDKYIGDWVKFGKSVSLVGDRVKNTARILKNMSHGKLTDITELKQVGKRSEMDELMPSMIGIGDALALVLDGVKEYIELIKAGEIEKINFDTNRYEGVYKEIFVGLNLAAKANVEPLLEVLDALGKMSNSDFTARVRGDYRGGFKGLKESYNLSMEELNSAFGDVLKTARGVENGANQVADSSTSLSQGATEQAASLEEMTSSMSQVASQTKRNAENANVANNLALEARTSSDKGEQEMKLLMKAMDEINESSKGIAKIIKVIDEIAFQTNLLALNAAVEAARAGVHGQGFAVVAEEVRNLAARSAQAAKETAEMIEGSIKTVDKGSHISQKTQEALNEIKVNVTKVNDIISEIAVSSNEQAQGIAQINLGLNQIDKVTQQNTATSEESATAADELSSQSRRLTSLILKFKLSGAANADHSYERSNVRGRSSAHVLPAANNFDDEFNIDLD